MSEQRVMAPAEARRERALELAIQWTAGTERPASKDLLEVAGAFERYLAGPVAKDPRSVNVTLADVARETYRQATEPDAVTKRMADDIGAAMRRDYGHGGAAK